MVPESAVLWTPRATARKARGEKGLRLRHRWHLPGSAGTGVQPAAREPAKTHTIQWPGRGTIPESSGTGRRDLLTNGSINNGAPGNIRRALSSGADAQKVVIVNGSPDILELFESVLEAGRYDIVFVESTAHAYSQIKRVQPNLVILCVRIDDLETFQVLSMLKIDDETRNIPILTYTADVEGSETEEESEETTDVEMFAPAPALRMN
jgi:CheY-like chemotaxis protein